MKHSCGAQRTGSKEHPFLASIRRTPLARRARRRRFRGLLRGTAAHPVVSALSLMITIALLFCFVPVRILDEEAAVQGRVLRVSSAANPDFGPTLRHRQRGGILGSIMHLKESRTDVDQEFRRPELPFATPRGEDGWPDRPGFAEQASRDWSEENASLDDLSSLENSNAAAGTTAAQGGDALDVRVFGRDQDPAADLASRRKPHDVYIRLRRVTPAHPVSELITARS